MFPAFMSVTDREKVASEGKKTIPEMAYEVENEEKSVVNGKVPLFHENQKCNSFFKRFLQENYPLSELWRDTLILFERFFFFFIILIIFFLSIKDFTLF